MKKFFVILALLFVLLFILAAFVPTIISTPSGTKWTVTQINKYIPGHLSIGKMQLSWLGKQKIENFQLQDDWDVTAIQGDLAETDTSLLYLLFGGRNLNKTTIHSPYLYFEKQENGETNIENALRPKKRSPHEKRKHLKGIGFPFIEDLTITNGRIILKTPSAQTELSDIQIETQPDTRIYRIEAKTRQGDQEGSILLKAHFAGNIQIESTIVNFPVSFLDQLQGTTLFSEALGKTMNAHLNFERLAEGITLKGNIESPNLKSTIDAEIKNGELFFNPKTQIIFTLTPSFFKQWIAPSQQNQWMLASKSALIVQIEKLVIPLNTPKFALKDVILNASASLDRAEISHSEGGSYSLNRFNILIMHRDNLEIDYKGVIQGKETADIAGRFSITPEKKVLYHYDYKGFPVSILEIFYPEAARGIRGFFGPSFSLLGEGTYEDKFIDTKFLVTAPNIQINGNLSGALPTLRFDALGKAVVPAEYTSLLGPSFKFDAAGVAELKEHTMTIPHFSGTAINAYYDLAFNGKIGNENEPFSYEQFLLKAEGSILQFPFAERYPYILFKNGSLFFNIDGSKNQIEGMINAEAESPSSSEKMGTEAVNGRFSINNFITKEGLAFKDADYFFSLDAATFPIVLLNPFLSDTIDATNLLGTFAKVKAGGHYCSQKNPRGELNIHAEGEGFRLLLAIGLDEKLTITQKTPSSLYWDITPARYDYLIKLMQPEPDQVPKFELVSPTPLYLKISEMTFPKVLPDTLPRFLCQSGFSGDLQIGKTAFRNKATHETLTIREIFGSIHGTNFSESIELKLKGDLFAENVPAQEQSGFNFEGKLLNFCTPDGKFNRNGLSLAGDLNLDLIPVRQMVGIIPMDQEIRQMVQAILGELVNAHISGQISHHSGPVTIDIKASNFKASVPIQLEKHAIYLRGPVDAEITLTEAVNETFLKDINPVLITGAFSEHPLRVYIDPNDFYLPIHPFSFKDLKIGKAIIDLGKIRVHNGGQIQSLMEFLKAKEVAPDHSMDAWFTPIFVNLQNGIASYKRFDALIAGSVHIAFWGSIDLIRDKVKMTLGIAPSTLQQRFGIKGLKKKDMFQVKMRGSTEKLELDWSSAYTRIGILIAKNTGGHIGYIVGGIVEQIVMALGETPVPPPTTNPFPWETGYSPGSGNQIPQEASPKKKNLMQFLIP